MFKTNEEILIDNSIESYIQANKKYPTLEHLSQMPDVGFFFQIIKENEELKEDFHKYLLVNLNKRILSKQSVKMRKELGIAYKKHKKLFEHFFLLNQDRKNLQGEEFHSVGEKIREIIEEVQTKIVGNLESGKSKYGVFSNSINDKFMSYLKEFFPLYDNIGVKIKTIKN